METALFAAELPAPALGVGDVVLRRGKVFVCGDYPDKGFSLSPDEARVAIAAFTPCPADLEHRATILDGKLGGLVSVEMGEDGALIGTVAEPKWLSDVLGEGARKVSLTWDKATKQIKGIAHVLNPRVSDAAVFSAYAAFSGEAVDSQPSSLPPTMKVFIPNAKGSQAGTPDEVVAFTGGAVGADTRGLQVQLEDGHLSRATPEQIVAFTGGRVRFETPALAESDEVKAMRERLARFEADAKTSREQSIATVARERYAALLQANRVTPADEEATVAAFTVALRYDGEREELAYFGADAPQANFSLGDHLKALYEKLPAHNLTREVAGGAGAEHLAVFDAEKTTVTNPQTGTVEELAKREADALLAERNRQAGIPAPEAK